MDIGAAAIDNLVTWWSAVGLARGGHVDRTAHLAAIDGLGPNPIVNRAIVLSPDADAAGVAAAVRASYDTRAGGLIGVLDAWDRVDLDGTDGWSRVSSFVAPEMVFDPVATSPGTVNGDVRQVVTAAELGVFNAVVRAGFDIVPWDEGPVLPEAVLDSPAKLFVAYADDVAVACAVGHDYAGVTGVYLVATKPEARGRGLGEAVTWAATNAFGAQPATLQASEQGAPVYERMGYVTTRPLRLWIRGRLGQ